MSADRDTQVDICPVLIGFGVSCSVVCHGSDSGASSGGGYPHQAKNNSLQ